LDGTRGCGLRRGYCRLSEEGRSSFFCAGSAVGECADPADAVNERASESLNGKGSESVGELKQGGMEFTPGVSSAGREGGGLLQLGLGFLANEA